MTTSISLTQHELDAIFSALYFAIDSRIEDIHNCAGEDPNFLEQLSKELNAWQTITERLSSHRLPTPSPDPGFIDMRIREDDHQALIQAFSKLLDMWEHMLFKYGADDAVYKRLTQWKHLRDRIATAPIQIPLPRSATEQ